MAYLMDSSHWQMEAVEDLKMFFQELPQLGLGSARLFVAGGRPSTALAAWLEVEGAPCADRHDLTEEFSKAIGVPTTDANLRFLAELASHRATPEIAVHLAVATNAGPVLEWFDLPHDGIALSPRLHEERVRAFSDACHVECARQGA